MCPEAAAVPFYHSDVTISTTYVSSHHNISLERDPKQKKKSFFECNVI